MNESFKIVKILDEYTIIVNAGSMHGVEVGDKFQILDEKGNEVKDPDTNEVLGFLDLIKDTVEVSEAYEKMSICMTPYQAKTPNVFSSSIKLGISETLSFSEQKKLNVDLREVTGGLRKSNKPVRLGDKVRLVKSNSKKETK